MPTFDGNNIRRYASTDVIAPGGKPEDLWNNLAADISTAITNVQASQVVKNSAADRDAYWGTPSTSTAQRLLQDRGAHTVRTDKGWTERYYATWNGTTNPGGASVAGWYPVAGKLPYIVAQRTATQSIGTTATGVNWDGIPENFEINWVSATPTRLTALIAGEYQFDVTSSVGSTGTATVYIRVNGTTNLSQYTMTNFSGAAPISFTQRVKLAANDYIEVMVVTNGAFNLLSCTLNGSYRRPRQA